MIAASLAHAAHAGDGVVYGVVTHSLSQQKLLLPGNAIAMTVRETFVGVIRVRNAAGCRVYFRAKSRRGFGYFAGRNRRKGRATLGRP